jgi:FKBP-type peptidyl-prolyl cis-trans isomerase
MNFQKRVVLSLMTLMVLFAFSCTKSQADKDREIIEEYIASHSLGAVEYGSTGLFYVIERPGGSIKPSYGSNIEVNYDGYLTDGTVFDSGDTLGLNLAYTILGWQYGIPLIGEGGRIKLLIPSTLGYGAKEVGDIPKNSVLIFDVDLILVN